MRRRIAILATTVALSACGAPQLSAPPEVTAPPTVPSTTTAPPVCTEEELAEDATRSYEPQGPLPPPRQMPPGSTMAEILENDRLIVGVSADTLEFGAIDPDTNDVVGFDIDILREVAKAIFGEGGEDKLQFRVMPYADRLPSLEANEVDLVAHTMTINCVRWKQIAFSSTYYDAGQKVLVPVASGIEDVDQLVASGATICVPAASTNEEEITKPDYAGIEVLALPDITDCLVAVQQGDADAATGDDTVLVGLAAQDPNLEVVGEAFTSEPYGIGVRANEVDLVQFVNGVLEEIRANGRWAEIYEEWVATPAIAPPEPVYGR